MDRRRSILRVVAWTALLTMSLYLLASSIAAYLLWQPIRREVHTDPSKYGLPYEDVSFSSTDGVTLRGWLIDTSGARTIMVLHGSGSVRDNYISMEMSRALAERGYDVLLFDFRGHGESGGSTFSLGAWEVRDIAGALDYLEGRGVADVGVLAYSMGAASALLAAPEDPRIRAIVADSSYADLATVIRSEGAKISPLMTLLYPGVTLMSRTIYGIDAEATRPSEAAARLDGRPLFLIHSTGDTLIPVGEVYKLQAAAEGNPNVEVWVAEGTGHVSSFADNRDEYVRRVGVFFDKYLESNTP